MTDSGEGLTYRDVGVDIEAATEALRTIKPLIRQTYDSHVLYDIGTFGAMYSLDPSALEEPVLVSSVDSVGSKLKLAFLTGIHDTVGIDIVCHCANDIVVQGARPLFFLDYIGIHKVVPETIRDIVKGLVAGCRLVGCALIGGEIAELPGMYHPGEYDLVGFIVGWVDRKKVVDGSKITPGNVLIGLPSSGLHTNGYTLARKICFEIAGLRCEEEVPGVGRTVAEALLEPHRSYVKLIQKLAEVVEIKGMAHITGGGITDNLPRILPEGLCAAVHLGSWQSPPIFRFLQETGCISPEEMLRTFNMGVGFLIVIDGRDTDQALECLRQAGEKPRVVGKIIEGEPKVRYTGNLQYGAPD